MQVTNVSIGNSTCSHIIITATVGGQQRTIHATREELQLDPSEVREAVVARLRSFARENNYTLAQTRTNLAGKVFDV